MTDTPKNPGDALALKVLQLIADWKAGDMDAGGTIAHIEEAALTPSPDYVLVPREITDEMHRAGAMAILEADYVPPSTIWKAMLDAAQKREG